MSRHIPLNYHLHWINKSDTSSAAAVWFRTWTFLNWTHGPVPGSAKTHLSLTFAALISLWWALLTQHLNIAVEPSYMNWTSWTRSEVFSPEFDQQLNLNLVFGSAFGNFCQSTVTLRTVSWSVRPSKELTSQLWWTINCANVYIGFQVQPALMGLSMHDN